MADFSAILNKRTSEIKKPKPLPVGTYLCTNPTVPEFTLIGKNESPAAVFQFQVIAPAADVDPEAVTEYTENIGEIRGKPIRHTMYLTERSEYRTKEELMRAFALEDDDQSLGEIFNSTVNRQVLVTIKHNPSKDGTEIYTEVEKLAAA